MNRTERSRTGENLAEQKSADGRSKTKNVIETTQDSQYFKNFDKYAFYEKYLQNPIKTIKFIESAYKKIHSRDPVTLREDFCGTGIITLAWVLGHPKRKGIGVDIDSEPLSYGKNTHVSKLTKEDKQRLKFIRKNVLHVEKVKADIIAALNSSIFLITERSELLKYFKTVRKCLDKKGIFVLDIHGGIEAMRPSSEDLVIDDYIYHWVCDSFNPISCVGKYSIDFSHKSGEYVSVFHYNLRLWSLGEITDLLEEAGFTKSTVHWQNSAGDFVPTTEGNHSPSWLSFIVSTKK